MRTFLTYGWLAFVLFFSVNVSFAQEVHSGVLYPLRIQTSQGDVNFQVEVAKSPAQLRRGLMFRESLPANQGMIFLHTQPKVIRMWMKNTPIALDMLFIDQFGTVRHIAREAKPFDETAISSVHVVVAVLEVNAGIVDSQGIAIGDKVILE